MVYKIRNPLLELRTTVPYGGNPTQTADRCTSPTNCGVRMSSAPCRPIHQSKRLASLFPMIYGSICFCNHLFPRIHENVRQVGISRFLLLANSPCSATDSSEQMNSDAYQPIYRWKALDFSFPTVYGSAYIRVHLFLRFCSTRSEPHFLVGINREEFLARTANHNTAVGVAPDTVSGALYSLILGKPRIDSKVEPKYVNTPVPFRS